MPHSEEITTNPSHSTTQPPKKRGRPFGSTKAKKQKVLWEPQPKQIEALSRTEYEVLYGGARGGGKTAAGIGWLLYPFYDFKAGKLTKEALSKYRALIIRLNAKDLSDWIDKAKALYQPLGAEFVGSPVEIRWPSGPIFRTGHLKDENAYTQYQGHEYQRMLIEELTQIATVDDYEKLISSCRSTVPGIDAQVFCTTNPGNVGHQWVKDRWKIEDKFSWGKPLLGMSAIVGDKLIERFRIFIHAKVEDNPKLLQADPGYVAQLESIADPNLKKAWRDGDWENPIIPGQIYKDEIDKAVGEGRIGEVAYDTRFPVHTYWDIGVGDAMAIWFMQYTGGAWKAIDYYQNSGKGFSHYRQILDQKGYFYGQHFGPHDLRKRQVTGTIEAETIADTAQKLGILFYILPRLDVNLGILTVKEKFAQVHFDKEKCRLGLDALINYRREWDDDKKAFTDKPLHDYTSHAADAFRYWAMAPEPALPNQMNQDFQLYNQSFS